jgi:hypothetical protein
VRRRQTTNPDALHPPALNVTAREVLEAAYESICTGREVSLAAR